MMTEVLRTFPLAVPSVMARAPHQGGGAEVRAVRIRGGAVKRLSLGKFRWKRRLNRFILKRAMITRELELTREEIVERLERGAQRRLGMSAQEMVDAYRSCTLKDLGRVADLLALASLLSKDDPLFVST